VSELRTLAEQIARAAGAVLRDRFSETRTIEIKGGLRSNLVTDADHASEALILEWLAREVPNHAVLAEESGGKGQGEFTWFVDPLDGTTNYAHGVPHFCVTLGVQGPAGMVVGVTYDPLRDELFSAAVGEGATLNGNTLRASKVTALDQAVLCTGFPYDVQQNPDAPLGLFVRLVRQAQGMRRMGSAALDLAYVAAGRFDGFFEFGLKPWDTAAGALLIREAGGQMSRIDGAPYQPLFGDVFAAAPGLSGELTKVCSEFVTSIGWRPTSFELTAFR
jgi:myo-inositol-1(or 4)-monophosphatase